MKFIDKVELVVMPAIDCEFYEVALEAALLVIEHDCAVSIMFNGAKYTADPLRLVEAFIENKEKKDE